VRDLAIGLDATIGPDPVDTATRILDGRARPAFVASLDTTALRGVRLGVLTDYFGTDPDDQEGARVVRAAIEKLRARGATVADVTIPGLDSLVNRASVIDYEFKYDLIDYLAGVPNAPVKSLADILERGLVDDALEETLTRRERNGTRDGEAYRAALGRRTAARDLVIAFLDSNRLDGLVYPTVRRKAAIIGEPQRGATCQLSAVTGLPALTMPAGFTPDSMPIGIEILGRPLADAHLVAMAYDYEQATHPRRPPPTTPPLVDGHAPAPVHYAAIAGSPDAGARGTFTFDPTRRTLEYAVTTSGVSPARIIAVTLDRTSGGRKGPVLQRLVRTGEDHDSGTLKLDANERAALTGGRLALVLYSRDEPLGTIRGALARVAP
jgi:hypothetical protein